MVLLEVLQYGSIGYGGKLIPPGGTFLCEERYAGDIVARNLAKIAEESTPTLLALSLAAKGIGDVPPESTYEVEGLKETEASRAEDRKNLFDELVSLGITPAAKTNTKTLRGLVQRARMEARQ
jgi:hypothetical protein